MYKQRQSVLTMKPQFDHNVQIITVQKKPPRNRGATWTDDEVHKLFHVWGQPNIHTAFLGRKKKQDLFTQISMELSKFGVKRTVGECRAKIKNLKGEFRKAKELRLPQTFKFYSLMENILNRPGGGLSGNNASISVGTGEVEDEDDGIDIISEITLENMKGEAISEAESDEDTQSSEEMDASNHHQSISLAASLDGAHHHQVNQPVQIEFELMSNVDFQAMKGAQLPIEIEGGNILIPHEYATSVDVDPTTIITHHDSHHHGTETSIVHHDASSSTSSGNKRTYSGAETSGGQAPLNAREIGQKRRKLNTISEKMAETVSRILTQTTNTLIEEMKASEERFMQWEEKRRQEDRKREEQMLKKLMEAINSPSSEDNCQNRVNSSGFLRNDGKELRTRERIQGMIERCDDPCAVTFDLLATNLSSMLSDQSKQTEEALNDWEERMQRQETKHTDNLFKMLLTSVSSNNIQNPF